MTVGLVAKCWWNEHLVAISDRRLSYNDVVEAPDNATSKAYSLSKTWGVLYSAGNIGPIPEIMRAVHFELYCNEGAVTEQTVRAAFRKAWWQSVNERVRDRYLAPLGINSLDEFRKCGFAELGQVEFSRITKLIENFDPEIQFLVYGFDQDGRPRGGHQPASVSELKETDVSCGAAEFAEFLFFSASSAAPRDFFAIDCKTSSGWPAFAGHDNLGGGEDQRINRDRS
jgi:hypothetical protein